MGGQKVPWMVVLHWNGRTYGNSCIITFKVHTQACSIDSATVGSAGGRLLLESSHVRQSHSISCPALLQNLCPWGPFLESGTAKSHSERDPDSTVIVWWQECFSGPEITAQQAMVTRCVIVASHHAVSTQLAHRNDKQRRSVSTNSWCTKQQVPTNSGKFLTARVCLRFIRSSETSVLVQKRGKEKLFMPSDCELILIISILHFTYLRALLNSQWSNIIHNNIFYMTSLVLCFILFTHAQFVIGN
jgi:hypothetical protein